jgi:hypothetical protein
MANPVLLTDSHGQGVVESPIRLLNPTPQTEPKAFHRSDLSNPRHLLENSLHNAGADAELLADLEDAIALIPERHDLSLHGRLHSAPS